MRVFLSPLTLSIATIFYLCLPVSRCHAQQPWVVASLDKKVDMLVVKADSLNKANALDQALETYRHAESAYLQSKNKTAYLNTVAKTVRLLREMFRSLEAINLVENTIKQHSKGFENAAVLGSLYYEYAYAHLLIDSLDTASTYAEKALQLFKQNGVTGQVCFAQLLIGDIEQWRVNYDLANQHYFKAKDLFENHFGSNDPKMSHVLFKLGTHFRHNGNLESAGEYFNRAKLLAEKGDDPIVLADLLRQFAYVDRGTQDYQSGLEKCEKALSIFQARFGLEHYKVTATYNTFGNLYLEIGNNLQAESYFQKAYDIRYKLLGPFHTQTYGMLMNVGVAQKEQKLYDKAIRTYEAARDIMEQSPVKSYDYFKIFRNIGLINLLQGDTTSARQSFAQSIEKGRQVLANDALDWIDVRLNQASIAATPIEALEFCQLAFEILGLDKKHSLELGASDFEKAPNPYYLFAVVTAQTFYTNKQYLKTGHIKDLRQTYDLSKQGLNIADHIRLQLKSEASQSAFYNLAKSHFHESLSIAWELQDKAVAIDDLAEWTFSLMERSKAWLVLESLSERRATARAGIPDSLLQLERSYQLDIDQQNQLLTRYDASNRDSIAIIRHNLFELKESLAQLQVRIKKSYPSYEALTDQVGRATISEIQSRLAGSKKLFLHYATTSDYIYLFAITENNKTFLRTHKEASFDQDIFELYHWLKEKNQNFVTFNDLVPKISHQLLTPVANMLVQSESLIIVPDGLLHYIPFEVLRSGNSGKYLIESKNISYVYSGSVLLELSKHNLSGSINFLAFAPEFNGQPNSESLVALSDRELVRGDLSQLFGVYKEVEGIKRYFEGSVLLKEHATETAFKLQAKDKGILHFATHAIIDDSHPLNSYLVLTDQRDEQDDGYLYTWELHNMDLNAQMVVLSACNTGYGKLEEGEGFVSLGRAFILAGCQSVVMSHWPAQDQSTASIMDVFYQELAQGQARDEALRNAKLDFINNSDETFNHPFYWAGFVVHGQTNPLSTGTSTSSFYWLLLLPLLLLLAYGWYRAREDKAKLDAKHFH